jgi:hypothetical protein
MAEDDEEEIDELRRQALLCAAIVGHGILESRRIKADHRRISQHYLTCPDLLPNPREGTPWQRLYASRNDMAFITVMGVNLNTFQLILSNGFKQAWKGAVIPRVDVSGSGTPREQR